MRYIFYPILCACLILVVSCKDSTSKPNKVENKKMSEAQLQDAYGKLYTYYHADPKTQDQIDENLIIEYLADKEIDAKRTNTGLYYLITKEGVGPKIQPGQKLKANYKGYFVDGKEFDSSYKRGVPLDFRQDQMVAGWKEGLLLMSNGASAMFFLPSKLGYGSRGFPGFVEPNKVIIFEMELLDK